MDLKKLGEWKKIKESIDSLTARELVLRAEIFAECFESPREGVNAIDLPKGYQLKATHRINRSVSQEAFAAWYQRAMSEHEIVSAEQARALFKPRWELVISQWKKLDPQQILCLAEVVTEKAGLPALEIVEPK